MKINIAVTGLAASEVTAPGVGVLRSLKAVPEREGRLIGLGYDPLEGGGFEPGLADDFYLLPFPSQGLSLFLDKLDYIRSRTPVDVLIPNLDAELPLLVNNLDALKAMGIKVFIPTSQSLKTRAKDRLLGFARDQEIAVPRTFVVSDEVGLVSAAENLKFPFLVKGLYYDAYLVYTLDEARGKVKKIVRSWGFPVIIQEFIQGREFDICALGDGRGGLVGAIPNTKLALSEKGKAWAGVTVSDPNLLEITRKIVGALNWRGPLEVEILKSDRDERYYLLEINPRFPAWVYLCQAAGQNLPWALTRLALGEEVTHFESYEVGIGFVRSARDLIVSQAEFAAVFSSGEIRR